MYLLWYLFQAVIHSRPAWVNRIAPLASVMAAKKHPVNWPRKIDEGITFCFPAIPGFLLSVFFQCFAALLDQMAGSAEVWLAFRKYNIDRAALGMTTPELVGHQRSVFMSPAIGVEISIMNAMSPSTAFW